MSYELRHDKALIIVDEQRGFMPAEEGQRLGVEGFGELPVPNGQRVVRPTNKMTDIFLDHGMTVLTTADNHPAETAHFSDNPNFTDTWPAHCVAGTPGAELHPELIAVTDPRVIHFIKGDVAARTPAEDNSYTSVLAHRTNPEMGEEESLTDYLEKLHMVTTYVCGLTIAKEKPLCADSTAIDLHNLGYRTAIVTDAVEAVVPEDRDEIFANLGDMGIRLITSQEAVAEVFGSLPAREDIR